MSVTVHVRVLAHGKGLPLPAYATAMAAGADLHAAIDEPMTLSPGATARVPLGLTLELPEGYEGQVRPRSGLAAKHGVTVLNAPGTIDADYRGEVMVLLVNHSDRPHRIARGDRIAQLVVAPAPQARFVVSEASTATKRGSGGFGSTGA